MRFMVMHKVDGAVPTGAPVEQRVIVEMGRLIQRSIKEGIFKDGAGLHGSDSRARISFASGAPQVARGPYAGNHELVARMALIATTGIDRAIELATELGEASGRREVEVGPVVETWDLHGGKRPPSAPYRFLLLVKGDAAYEAGAPMPAAADALLAGWKRDGLLESATELKPSKHGARTRVRGGKRTWTDGPFTEAKELIGGFSVLEVPSIEEARRFTEAYVAILGDVEVDVRELEE